MADTITQANRDIAALQPVAQEACKLFLEECEKRGIAIFITETHRSQARQDYLYEQGRTRPGNIVTWTRNSNHTGGMAWDIAVSPPNKLYDATIIAKAGQVAKDLGIEWGGTWKEQDTPHFQVNSRWKAPVKEDDELKRAVTKIIDSGIKINDASWNRLDRINLNNVPALLNKLGGLDKLILNNVIGDVVIWIDKKYNANHVRSLLIKYASKLG